MKHILNANCILDAGWVRVERNTDSPETATVIATPTSDKNELWTVQPSAQICLQLPEQSIANVLYVTLNLRSVAPITDSIHTQRVMVYLGNTLLDTLHVASDTAYTKLIVIPVELLNAQCSCRLSLHLPDAINNQRELIGIAEDAVVGVELSSMVLFASLPAYLASVQSEYDMACATRNGLFSQHLSELTDRGELLDAAKITLAALAQKNDTAYQTACAKLTTFLNDPYINAQQDTRICFDESYYHAFYPSLKEGLVQQAIREWVAQLETFNRLVIDIGNKVFSLPSGQTAQEQTFIQHLAQLELAPEKLAHLKTCNAQLNHLEILLQKRSLSSVPPSMEIEITSACNYQCVMCGLSYHRFQATAQDEHDLFHLIKVLPYVKHVTVAGVGESTMNGRLNILASMLEKFDCDSRIFTNGSLIHKQLDALSRFKRVCISFDGANAQTFETQRRGARFEQVKDNIALLRERAPDIQLAFSVVVSRLNMDEVADIVRVGASLGINIVALSAVEHIPALLLRQSDKALFNTVFAEAQAIARAEGVVLENNIGVEHFSAAVDEPRDKAQLLQHFQSLPLHNDKVSRQALLAAFEQVEFHYHPSAAIHPQQQWPALTPVDAAAMPAATDTTPTFDIDVEIKRLESEIAQLIPVLQQQTHITIPYCLSIWNYAYIRANGKLRLCPQHNVDASHSLKANFKDTLNSDTNQAYRATMFNTDGLHDRCQTCLDHYRHWDVQTLLAFCDSLTITPHNLACYAFNESAPV